MHGLMADSAGGAWTFGGSILSFLFPMLLLIGVVATLFILYTKPEVVPGHEGPEHPVSYTRFPGQPTAAAGEQAEAADKTPAAGPGGSYPPAGSVPPDNQEPEGGE
jgi:hypothetical protein